ncbi:chemotaxis protein CheW [Desulfonatronovibrio hydrogenovorans]|uniref:chemotaxis protein CheW n=1 Tax=Desulfonatronovibrio hydrogenovorans TaxID=53245 RepID=UPI000490AECD|nr:chemotaxis protein CheW [Desulfonatronovibrio hydrogenovorans]
MKTPEQYFEEQEFDLEASPVESEPSPKEKLFIQKYLGGESEQTRASLAQADDSESLQVPQAPVLSRESGFKERQAVPKAKTGTDRSDLARLRGLDEVQLVSFFLDEQEYALPIETVKEVIKFIQPTRLPAAPSYLEGVVNLRQKVTPIVRLAYLLNPSREHHPQSKFIVVCHQEGFQVGLLVESIATMYRMPGKDIEWNVESVLGMSSSYVSALIKNREKIISILSIDRIVDHLLSE